jgi:hypothetical protein
MVIFCQVNETIFYTRQETTRMKESPGKRRLREIISTTIKSPGSWGIHWRLYRILLATRNNRFAARLPRCISGLVRTATDL